MEQQADYIRRIEIKGLWARFNIQWDLRPDVNILSGINGVGTVRWDTSNSFPATYSSPVK